MNTDKHRLSRRSLAFGILFLLFTIHCSLFTAAAQTRDYTRWVNPFIGTGGHGHTFPGATMPFGMVQLSPDTRIDNWDGSSGYHYSDDIIYGFSHTHLSGTGIPDGADILFMPTVANIASLQYGRIAANGYPSKFSHANENAEPGYYSVQLDNHGIFAEMTSTKRVGFHRYTFPIPDRKTIHAVLSLDLKWRDKLLDSEIRLATDGRIEGFRKSSSWAKNQTIYFVAEFSKPVIALSGALGDAGSTPQENLKVRRDFNLGPISQEPILLKVAISYVSIEGARKNLEAELPHWDFDKVRADARAAWNNELSKIEVSGGTDEQTTNFYTALFHTMIHPNVFNDVDGNYLGHDRKIHNVCDTKTGNSKLETENCKKNLTSSESRVPSSQYTVFSLWDTFRATHPLYTIIDQKRTVDYINSFIRIYEQGGRLPVWELWGEETDTMIGYHSVSVIADAMAKGIKGFDYEKAYEAAKHSANLDHYGLAAYKKRGYISGEDDNESVSKTLEYAYNDWCIAQMAKILHKTDDTFYYQKQADEFLRRSRYFENLFDPSTGYMRPKRNGGFTEPFAPNEVTFHFTEGNSWQYSFFAPHDVSRLMELMGGREKFAEKLDELFTTEQKLTGRFQPDITGLIGQYAHGNEPSHHIPYLYNYAGQPWKTQKYVRNIMDEFYKNAPDGLIGNEDAGQMSAWYILSASGFYPLSPGRTNYAFGTPLFPEMTYNLENGKKFTIRANNISAKNIYIAGAKLNGKPYPRSFITHDIIMSGGVLEFEMTDRPSKTAFTEFPVSKIEANSVAVPVIKGLRTFQDDASISLETTRPGMKIFYTTDGNVPTEKSSQYSEPFEVKETAEVKAIAVDQKGNRSLPVEARFQKRSNDWTAKLYSEYNQQYPGNGEDTIIDGLRGNQNFAAGEWQGFQGKTFEAVIDLQRETEIKSFGGSFLQSARSWIWMPVSFKFEISNNGSDWSEIAEIKTDVHQTEMNPTIKEFRQSIPPTKTRYVRVRAFNFGKIPEWHLGAGGDPWIFVDEIFIN